jgi:hypothetical protein
MATRDDVRRIVARLPGATESEESFGFWVENKGKAKGFIWLWNERVDPKKKKVPNQGVLAITTPNLTAKELWLSTDPEKFFTEPHYNGYPAVLVRLELVEVDELEDLVIDAWKTKAPKNLIQQYEAGHSS